MQEFYLRATSELPALHNLVMRRRRGGVSIQDSDDGNANGDHTDLDYVGTDALPALDDIRRHLQRRALEEQIGSATI